MNHPEEKEDVSQQQQQHHHHSNDNTRTANYNAGQRQPPPPMTFNTNNNNATAASASSLPLPPHVNYNDSSHAGMSSYHPGMYYLPPAGSGNNSSGAYNYNGSALYGNTASHHPAVAAALPAYKTAVASASASASVGKSNNNNDNDSTTGMRIATNTNNQHQHGNAAGTSHTRDGDDDASTIQNNATFQNSGLNQTMKMSASKENDNETTMPTAMPMPMPMPANQNQFHPDLPFLITHWLSQYQHTSIAPPVNPPTTTPTPNTTALIQPNLHAKQKQQQQGQAEALSILQNIPSQLAWAFQTLGAYGQSYNGSTSYSDVQRTYSSLLVVGGEDDRLNWPRKKEKSGGGGSGTSGASDSSTTTLLDELVTTATMAHTSSTLGYLNGILPWSLLEAAYEGSVPNTTSSSDSSRRYNDYVNTNGMMVQQGGSPSKQRGRKMSSSSPQQKVGRNEYNYNTNSPGSVHVSPGRRLSSGGGVNGSGGGMVFLGGNNNNGIMALRDTPGSAMINPHTMGSNNTANHNATASSLLHVAKTSREQLSLRIELAHQRIELERAVRNLGLTTTAMNQQQQPNTGVVVIDSPTGTIVPPQNRVKAQLERRTSELGATHRRTEARLTEAKRMAGNSYNEMIRVYNDGEQTMTSFPVIRGSSSPRSQLNLGYGPKSHSPGKNNMYLSAILSRQYMNKRQPQPHHGASSPSSSQTALSVLKSQLSHAVTISSHLIYPIYCLKFDKTGRYFITGSDDQVAKVFHLGAGADRTSTATTASTAATTSSVGGGTTTTGAAENNNNNRPTLNYGANVRGAVLVCSLRGHAGVVTDIDVSADNALLATASGDGDVRIWGLKDGHPVAILRGHKDGANMVRLICFRGKTFVYVRLVID